MGVIKNLLDGLSDQAMLEDFPWLAKIFKRRAEAVARAKRSVEGKVRKENPHLEVVDEMRVKSPFFSRDVADSIISREQGKLGRA